MIAAAAAARASDWNYGCKDAFPVFDDSEVTIFNRELLVLLPKAWLKEALRELLARDASEDVIAIAKAKDEKIRDWLRAWSSRSSTTPTGS